jgi:preprotein translocase SecE subunit
MVTTDQERLNVASKMADKKKNASRSQMAEPATRGSEKERPARSVKTAAREERKEQSARQESKRVESKRVESRPARREVKKPSALQQRIRNSRIGSFIIEAYYELRHKVTWPTFIEARNMTIAVIVLSAVIGGILALADFGLYHLFFLISGGK